MRSLWLLKSKTGYIFLILLKKNPICLFFNICPLPSSLVLSSQTKGMKYLTLRCPKTYEQCNSKRKADPDLYISAVLFLRIMELSGTVNQYVVSLHTSTKQEKSLHSLHEATPLIQKQIWIEVILIFSWTELLSYVTLMCFTKIFNSIKCYAKCWILPSLHQ